MEAQMSRRCRFSILIVASLAVLAIVSATSAAQPRAQAARTCFYRTHNYGYSYLTYLAVRNTSCTTGRYVAHKHGHVSGWSCHKRITAKGPVQYDASVTCKSGRRQVVWSFAQNTA
jgi:hypothetical protein